MERHGAELTYALTFEDVIEIIKLLDAGRIAELRLETDGLDLKVVFRHESGDPGEPARAGAALADPPGLRPATGPAGESPGSPSPAAVPAVGPDAGAAPAAGAAPDAGAASAAAAGRTAAAGSAAGTAPASALPAGAVPITAPLEGVFYRAPSPGEPPFVEVGRRVGEGDRVGLIEVMKLFTPVVAACSGVVSEIRAENQQLVHSGQVLVVIAPAER